MSDFKAFKRIIILVLILIVPGFLYYLLQAKGKNRYKPLPIYGPKQIAKTFHKVRGNVVFDTLYHHVPDFRLYDQNNQPVTQKTFAGKIILVNFFFTHCPVLCNEINSNIAKLAGNYKKNSMIRFASITVDPANDSTAVLNKYAGGLKADAKQWKFLTGDTSVIYPLSRKGFLVTAASGNKPEDSIYSEKLILIDQEKRIRGYYNGTSVNEMTQLNDEIKVLIAEELRKIKSNLY